MNRITFLIIIVTTIIFNSCASYTLSTPKKKWLEFELPPSKITKSGEVFFEGKLSSNSKFVVFFDEKIEKDENYYYTMLMQDFGWNSSSNDKWTAPQGTRNTKLGHIYINSSRQVAVYFYPQKTYSAFKINIKNESSETQ